MERLGAVLGLAVLGWIVAASPTLAVAADPRPCEPAGQTEHRWSEGYELMYRELDQFNQVTTGTTLHEYLIDFDPLRRRLPDEDATRRKLPEWIAQIRTGHRDPLLALYTVFAGEQALQRRAGGGYRVASFSGMNVTPRIVLELLDGLLADVQVTPSGKLSGVGRLRLPVMGQDEPVMLEVDFDSGRLVPEVIVEGALGASLVLTAADVNAFVQGFLSLRGCNEARISVFLRLPDPATLRHEILHALYAAEPEYREEVRDRARKLSQEQREYAILFTAAAYDALNPDTARRNPELVLDEALNAYLLEGAFDPERAVSSFSIGDFMRNQGVSLSLSAWHRIADLPASEEDHARLEAMYAFHAQHETSLTERQFLSERSHAVLDNLHCLRFLRQLLIEQQPDFYRRVVQARERLVDSQVGAPPRFAQHDLRTP